MIKKQVLPDKKAKYQNILTSEMKRMLEFENAQNQKHHRQLYQVMETLQKPPTQRSEDEID